MSFLDKYIKKRSEKSSDFDNEYQNQGLIKKFLRRPFTLVKG